MPQPWSQQEVGEVVKAYFQLLGRSDDAELPDQRRAPANLKRRALPDRSIGAIEFKMQNISDVLDEQGVRHLAAFPPRPGFRDMGQVQEALKVHVVEVACKKRLLPEGRLAELFPEWQPEGKRDVFEARVAALRAKNNLPYPSGNPRPKRASRQQNVYERDPLVRAWVLQKANGRCERCNGRAFLDRDGEPYLEGHHITPLSEGGPDTPENTAALCPNCHRMLHHSADAAELRTALLARVTERRKKQRGQAGTQKDRRS